MIARENLRHDGEGKGLAAVIGTQDSESSDERTGAIGPGDNNAASDTGKREKDEDGLAAPVVSSLADGWIQDDGKDGDARCVPNG
jgi:hypothetical protein